MNIILELKRLITKHQRISADFVELYEQNRCDDDITSALAHRQFAHELEQLLITHPPPPDHITCEHCGRISDLVADSCACGGRVVPF